MPEMSYERILEMQREREFVKYLLAVNRLAKQLQGKRPGLSWEEAQAKAIQELGPRPTL